MPSNRHNTPADVRPTLLFWVAVTAMLALFGVASAIALMVVDANYVDLPNPMVGFASVFGGTATIVCVTLGMAHLLRVSGVANTRAAVAAVLEARRDLKEDTGEIPRVLDAVQHPHYIVVRDMPTPKAAARQAEKMTAPTLPPSEEPSTEDGEQLPPGMATQIWTMAERATERRLRGDAPA